MVKFVYMYMSGWSVLGYRFGLIILSFYPRGSFVVMYYGSTRRYQKQAFFLISHIFSNKYIANEGVTYMYIHFQVLPTGLFSNLFTTNARFGGSGSLSQTATSHSQCFFV